MKHQFILFQRAGIFYCEDTGTGKQTSLRTRDRDQAQRLLNAKNEALRQPAMNLQIAQVYLHHSDPALASRTWQKVMEHIITTKHGSTQARWRSAIKDKAFDLIRHRRLLESTGEQFLTVLHAGTVATNLYLRRIHHYAVTMHWLPWPVLSKLHWPPLVYQAKRAITLDEHWQLLAVERSPVRRAFYEILWHFGGSQTDMARLTAEDIDWQRQTIAYRRHKSGTMAVQAIGAEVAAVLRTLPQAGYLFPTLADISPSYRGHAFVYRLKQLGITGLTLHSYRYAWAERAKAAGYPERFAMQALGHKSEAVHRAYAKQAAVVLPPLEEYEFAKHMRDALPKASFIGFTGTPIESGDKNTQAVFGDYIDVYDILQSKEDKATVPIYYEARLAKIDLKPEERPKIDPNFEEVTEDAEEATKESLRRKWAQLEAMVGTDKRIALVAEDLVKHWEARYAAMEGKAMVVCMSRRICVELYKAIQKLRPDWHHDDDDKGVMKIVMSGSASDHLEWQQHIRSKARREELAKAFKNPKKPFRIVIVRDMWLTGFDAPSLHTMYVDKPMRGHGLMQAIARVNRVFKDKPGGLVVDYLGLAEELKQALADYTNSKGKGDITLDQEEAVAVMLERYERVCGIMHGFDFVAAAETTAAKRLPLIAQAAEHVLQHKDGKPRYLQGVSELSKAFALAVPHDSALEIRDEVGFFQEIRAVLAKSITEGGGKSPEELELAVRQIVSRAISSDKVIDIFDAAGLKKPDISILSDEFLAEVKHLPQRNLAVELLQKLLNNELKIRSKKYLVQSRSFAEMLEATIRKYQNRTIEAAQVIAELIELAKQMREGQKRGKDLGLTDDEVAFYDALEVNDSAVKELGDPILKQIAQELVTRVRQSVTIDWTLRENARAQIRVLVRRILRKYGYPPDKQEKATQTVLEQAELLGAEWAEKSES